MRYITEYKNRWPASFRKIAGVIRTTIPKTCKIHHVGSTSIPGMPSKDVIDLDIECPVGAMTAVIETLARVGYEHEGDKGIPGREAFRVLPGSLAETLPPHHLYACEQSAQELHKHLAFREFLTTYHNRMIWLSEQKRLADQKARSRDEYIRNKTQAYEAITDESLAWAATTGKNIGI